MNRTLLTLAGLLLAAPLVAQEPSLNERKASELLQLSAQKALAGYETEAAKLADEAMQLLANDGTKVEGKLRFVLEEDDNAHEGGVIIVEGPDGREVIEFIGSDPFAENLLSEEEQLLGELGYIVEMQADAGHGETFEWSHDSGHDSDHDVIWMTDGDVHHNAPMDNGDLHQQLREIQHELEALRHELRALRSEMGGNNRRGGRGDMGGMNRMRFQGGEWNSNNNQGMNGNRFQFRMTPGQMHGMELHSLEGLPQRLELHGMRDMSDLHELHEMHEMHEMDLHEMLLDDFNDFDFELEAPEGAEVHEEVVVIINGEKFTGDAARKKLEELNVNLHGGAEGKVRMRMMGNGRAFPTPPEPPKAPQRNLHRSNGHDHEDV